MAISKEWDWKKADKERWLKPSEDGVYFAKVWKEEGAETILDLGCGLGRHTLYFGKNGFTVTAVDLSKDAVESTTSLCKEAGINISCRVADMMNFPFEADAFDRVFSYHVISHQDTAGVQAVIDEITRVLKPGGKVFLTLCSKQHYAFSYPGFKHLDENTVLKNEEAEVDVPHFFADKDLIIKMFHDYDLLSVRHITDCEMKDDSQERSHYFICASVKREEKN